MSNRRSGRYSPNEGLALPPEGFTGTPDVPCPSSLGEDARSWWATWATSQYAHFFGPVEWQDLADTARLMDAYYENGNSRDMAEARQHMNNLFGLANRARLHISEEQPSTSAAAPVGRSPRERSDPRLKAL